MRTPPPDVLASWPEPNYTNPATRGDGLVIVNVITMVLAVIVVVLRLYTRIRITGSFGFDDLLILFALVFATVMIVATSVWSELYGLKHHLWDIEPDRVTTGNKLNLVFQISFCFASTATKISLLWFCKRLLGSRKEGFYQKYSQVIIGSMVTVLFLCLIFLSMTIFQCRPMKAYWDYRPKYEHKCLNEGKNMFAASIVNIFTDLLVTVVPMPLIWSLKLPRRQRIAVISVFGLGMMVNVAGTIRTYLVYRSSIESYDETWMNWPMVLTSTLEINLGLICASVPALRPLIAYYAPQLFQLSFSNGRSGSPSTTNNRVRKLRKSTSAKDSGNVLSSVSQEPVVQHQSGGDFSDFRDLHESHHSSHVRDLHILDEDSSENNSHPLHDLQGVHTLQAFEDSPMPAHMRESVGEYRDAGSPYSPTDSIGIFRPTEIECWYEERSSESGKSTPPRSAWRRDGPGHERSRGFDDNFAV
ncbi:hypothetical protein FQN54_007496 [Arachnomyces sp. PD_36]|nr:hypothetical protein FQN54_007496 [Arachnomyces sp. PD_36]